MKNKTFLIAILIFIAMTVLSQIILPKAAEDATEKANMPKPDYQYIKIGRAAEGSASSSYTEVQISESDQKLLKDYINFGGREWTKLEESTQSGAFRVEINKDQCFYFTADTSGDIKVSALYVTNTDDGTKIYTTEITGTAAAPLLVLLQGRNK